MGPENSRKIDVEMPSQVMTAPAPMSLNPRVLLMKIVAMVTEAKA